MTSARPRPRRAARRAIPVRPVAVLALAAISAGLAVSPAGGHGGCCDVPAIVGPVPPAEGIGTAVYVNGQACWDYRPTPAVVRPETRVPAARFPAIDVHCHWSLDVDPEAMIAAMEERNVARAVNLSGGWGEELRLMCEKYLGTAEHRARFAILCNVDFSRVGEPDFAERVARELRAAKAMGVSGLKVFKNLGLTARDVDGSLIPVDDPRLDVIWRTCGELDFPVLIHSADPIAFFDPIDCSNERWMQLARWPSWSFHGPEFPSWREVIDQFERMIARHRGTRFIAPHMANAAEHLAVARRMLEEHENLWMDISGRVGEIGRRPYTIRRLFLEFPDRIMFGTDRYPGRPDQPRHRIYFRFLETDDEYFDYYDHPFPPAGDWKIHGIFLPEDVLRQVYHDTAARVYGWPTLAERAAADDIDDAAVAAAGAPATRVADADAHPPRAADGTD